MSGSNSEWGDLAASDDGLAELWDGYRLIPEPGENAALDALVASKHITHAALMRVGARLVHDQALAFAFPGGIKYRRLENGKKWSAYGSDFHSLKIVRAGATPADTVLVAEGETDAARLTLLYPDADVAVIPAGAKKWTPRFAEQVASYPRVVVCLDADDAGTEGWKKIRASVGQAVRLTPPPNPDNDWCGLPADVEPPPLPEPVAPAERCGGLTFTPLLELFEAGVPAPEVLVDDMVYTEGVHLVSGHPGCGKTTLVAYWALDVALDKSRHVVWLDYESGKRQTVRRLLSMGAPPALFERLHYAEWPAEAEKYLADVADAWPGAMIVLDSMSKALSQAGIDENSNAEVVTWTTKVVKACKDFSLPVIIIDHISKGGGQSEYSRGAGTKLADVDVHWRVTKESDFNRTTAGKISVKQMKDREGFLPFATWWQVGDGCGNLTLLPLEGPDEEPREDPSAPPI